MIDLSKEEKCLMDLYVICILLDLNFYSIVPNKQVNIIESKLASNDYVLDIYKLMVSRFPLVGNQLISFKFTLPHNFYLKVEIAFEECFTDKCIVNFKDKISGLFLDLKTVRKYSSIYVVAIHNAIVWDSCI